MQRLVPAVLVTVFLAGCFGPPDIPQDAATDTDEALPGLALSAWTDEHGERVRMHGVLVNSGQESYDIRAGCGEPWNSTLVAPDGSHVNYVQRPVEGNCAAVWDVLRPKAHLEVLYSWDFQDHDIENNVHEPVPPGNYTWVLQFSLRDRPETLETRVVVSRPS